MLSKLSIDRAVQRESVQTALAALDGTHVILARETMERLRATLGPANRRTFTTQDLVERELYITSNGYYRLRPQRDQPVELHSFAECTEWLGAPDTIRVTERLFGSKPSFFASRPGYRSFSIDRDTAYELIQHGARSRR